MRVIGDIFDYGSDEEFYYALFDALNDSLGLVRQVEMKATYAIESGDVKTDKDVSGLQMLIEKAREIDVKLMDAAQTVP